MRMPSSDGSSVRAQAGGKGVVGFDPEGQAPEESDQEEAQGGRGVARDVRRSPERGCLLQTALVIGRVARGQSESYEAGADVEQRLAGLRGGGSPLSMDVRRFMEPRFDADFAGVRVHTGGVAEHLARDLGARAFTQGSDIFMGTGQYSPGSREGDRLLAHELTHVVQQGAAGAGVARASGGAESNAMERGHGSPELQRADGEPDGGATVTSTAPAPAVAAPVVTKTTVKGPSPFDRGGYKWVVQWVLDKPSPAGGWIVQKINVASDVKDKDGKKVATGFDAHVPYWEAWKVNKGQSVTTYAKGGDVDDDTFSSTSFAAKTKGKIAESGSAAFYEGLTLPASFVANNVPPAGILPATKSDPSLAGGSAVLAHNLTAEWDSSGGDKTTKLTTA